MDIAREPIQGAITSRVEKFAARLFSFGNRVGELWGGKPGDHENDEEEDNEEQDAG